MARVRTLRSALLRVVLACTLGLSVFATPGHVEEETPDDHLLTLPITRTQWSGDFEAMRERRMVRVLVPPSRTLFFNDRGQDKGLTAELVRDFETYINKKYRKELQSRPITVVLIPTTRDQLLPHLVSGLGDIAAGDLTMTESRLEIADFVSPPEVRPVRELIVTGPRCAPISTVDELSGRAVHVRPSTSYHESLLALNARFQSEGKAPVKLIEIPDALEDEDILEMLNGGLFDIVVVDDWLAKMWKKVLPNIVIHDDMCVRDGARIGWAIRKQSPELRAIIEECYKNFVRKQGVLEYRFVKYNKNVKHLQDPTGHEDWKRFEQILTLFRKYGDQYAFDPLMLAAQGYQESRLDQSARGPTGAVGIMQLMPATAASLKVGDVTITEPNIHAGAKYMSELASKYFSDPGIGDLDRSLFCFAAYNAGPARVASLRKTASARGIDPNVWFNNVELVAAEKIGRETTTYVRNIYKYYVSYRLETEIDAREQKARDSMAPPANGKTRSN